ncbi:MAG TPA: cytochrome c biogenesis protein CcsA [Acidimicrobiales bacterium]|nr:cytochrome c biogenesis protein CcsA [Acidimicrobiales bacterium]
MKLSRGEATFGLVSFGLLAATVAAGLALPPTVEQEEYARLIAVHPPIAWVAYLSFGVMALGSLLYLLPATRHPKWDRLAAASAELGVVFTALMLATGSIWGRPTWGVYWVWDARLTLSALMLALLVGYGALRRITPDPARRGVVCAVTGLAAVVVIPVNHFAVTWWRTLHQGRSLAQASPGSDLDGSYVAAMLLGFVAMSAVYGFLLMLRVRVERLEGERDVDDLSAAIAERRREGAVVA